MGYPTDLDEISNEKLLRELGKRMRKEMVGKCSYCAMPQSVGSCRFKERHDGNDRLALLFIRTNLTSSDDF